MKITRVLTDNGKAFTDRLFGLRKREATGQHEFDLLCADLGIEHRLAPPMHPQTNGMVERFNGRIEDVLQSHRFLSGEDLDQTLQRYVHLYNTQFPQSALKGRMPIAPSRIGNAKSPTCSGSASTMSRKVMAAVLAHREVAPLLSDDHFSVDGTLVKAWASMKSFQPKAVGTPPDDDPGDPPGPALRAEDHPEQPPSETDPMPRPTRQSRNAEVDFRGEKRSNATHASTTDPDARHYKKPPAQARCGASSTMP